MSRISKIYIDNELLTAVVTGEIDPSTGIEAPRGSLYVNRSGAAASTLYIKTGSAVTDWSAVQAGGVGSVAWVDVTGKPSGLVSSSAQVAFSGLGGLPSGLVSASAQVVFGGLAGLPSGILSSSAQLTGQTLTWSGAQTFTTINSDVYRFANSALAMGIQGNYNVITDPTSRIAIYMGNQFDAGNYYDNTNHYFRNRAGQTMIRIDTGSAVTRMTFNAGAGGITTGYLYASSNEFGLLHSNGNWAVRALTGSGQNLFLYDTAGTQHLAISASGVYLSSNALWNGNTQRIWNYTGDNYHRFYAPGVNTPAILLGNSGDPANYYDNGTHWFRSAGGGTTFGYVNSNGFYSSTFRLTSDIRVKSNIQPLISASAILDGIAGYHYTKNGLPETGVIAQEVQQVLPDAVSVGHDEMLTVNYNSLIAVLVEEVKSLRSEVEKLKHAK